MDPGALVQIFFAGLMLVTGFVVGEILERRHYNSIRARELRWRRMPAITLGTIPVPEGWDYEKAGLVTGHVVISVDHFKRFVAGLRQIFGGRIRAYETLMDRARREAVLRLTQHAIDEGYHADGPHTYPDVNAAYVDAVPGYRAGEAAQCAFSAAGLPLE